MTQKEEKAYLEGERAAWRRVLSEAAKALGYKTDDGKLAAYLAEREQAIAALRDVCETYGDNDWEPDLHLADIIEKHLGRDLDEAARERGEPG